jgi:hypothetical protein
VGSASSTDREGFGSSKRAGPIPFRRLWKCQGTDLVQCRCAVKPSLSRTSLWRRLRRAVHNRRPTPGAPLKGRLPARAVFLRLTPGRLRASVAAPFNRIGTTCPPLLVRLSLGWSRYESPAVSPNPPAHSDSSIWEGIRSEPRPVLGRGLGPTQPSQLRDSRFYAGGSSEPSGESHGLIHPLHGRSLIQIP